MPIEYNIQEFDFGQQRLRLSVPDEQSVKEDFTAQQQKQQDPVFPYWAKLWPASLAMCEYIEKHAVLIKGKVVLELAAGLGLPSILASQYARKVICSDYVPEAIENIKRSALLNHIGNINCRLIDWEQFPEGLEADILLISDVNYDPAQFEMLYRLFNRLLQQGMHIILSTPQRIMGKPFIEKLLPFCVDRMTSHVETGSENAEILIMQLKFN